MCLFVFAKKGQRIYNNKFVFNRSVWSKRKVHLTKKIFQFPPGYSAYYSLTNTSAHQEKNKLKYIQERIESLKSVKFKPCYISSSRKFCLKFQKMMHTFLFGRGLPNNWSIHGKKPRR